MARRGKEHDALQTQAGARHFDGSKTEWLVGNAIALLHATDEDAVRSYRRAIEELADMGDAASAVQRISGAVPQDDASLRWALLYVLADVGDPRSIEVFHDVAVEAVPSTKREGCESAEDGEVLVRTMAIEALGRQLEHDGAVDALLDILRQQPRRALRVEAVKALGDRARLAEKLLDKDERWMLDLEIVDPTSVTADLEERPEKSETAPVPPLDRYSPLRADSVRRR